MRILKHMIWTVLLALLALPAAAGAEDSGALTVTPETVNIGATFDGTKLHVEGAVPAGSDVIVRLVGAAKDLRMKVKGKAMGLLWMNLDSLTIKGAPSAVLVASSRSLGELGPAAASYGLEQTLKDIGIAPADKDDAKYREEFLKLKNKEGLYDERAGVVRLAAPEGDRERFSADLNLPSRLSPGDYRLEAVAVKDGAVAAKIESAVKVQFSGVPAKMADVAFNHALMYGILATLVALLGGLAIGLVFQRKSAH